VVGRRVAGTGKTERLSTTRSKGSGFFIDLTPNVCTGKGADFTEAAWGDAKEAVKVFMDPVPPKDVQPRAQSALSKSPIFELRDLRVERENGALVLSGVVSSFYHKQLAQEVVRTVCRQCQQAETELINSIRVT
jgi:hypothetical protein